jgi:hypothetical protein
MVNGKWLFAYHHGGGIRHISESITLPKMDSMKVSQRCNSSLERPTTMMQKKGPPRQQAPVSK